VRGGDGARALLQDKLELLSAEIGAFGEEQGCGPCCDRTGGAGAAKAGSKIPPRITLRAAYIAGADPLLLWEAALTGSGDRDRASKVAVAGIVIKAGTGGDIHHPWMKRVGVVV